MSPYCCALPLVFLKPGEIVLSETPMVVTTLLGSCVAVTMFSPRQRLGVICHALLPSCRKGPPLSHGHTQPGKYVECAIRLMLAELKARGAVTGEIEAKLFGGAEMFDTVKGKRPSVGSQNMEMALKALQEASVRLLTHDLGGQRGRKIVFHTHTGAVFLKRLKRSEF